MKIRIGSERRSQRRNRAGEVAFCRTQDAQIREHRRIIRLEAARLVERALRAREIVAPSEARREAEVNVCRREARRGGRVEFRLGARAVACLQARVAEAQMRLAVARIVADDAFERRDERGARQLAGGHLRDARGQRQSIFRIGAR